MCVCVSFFTLSFHLFDIHFMGHFLLYIFIYLFILVAIALFALFLSRFILFRKCAFSLNAHTFLIFFSFSVFLFPVYFKLSFVAFFSVSLAHLSAFLVRVFSSCSKTCLTRFGFFLSFLFFSSVVVVGGVAVVVE